MSVFVSWVILVISALFEVAWAISLKYSDGLSKLVPSILTFIFYFLSLVILAKAVKNLPIGTSYGVWVGIGAFGTAILGVFFFQEALTLQKMFFLALLLISVVGLGFSS